MCEINSGCADIGVEANARVASNLRKKKNIPVVVLEVIRAAKTGHVNAALIEIGAREDIADSGPSVYDVFRIRREGSVREFEVPAAEEVFFSCVDSKARRPIGADAVVGHRRGSDKRRIVEFVDARFPYEELGSYVPIGAKPFADIEVAIAASRWISFGPGKRLERKNCSKRYSQC